MTRRIKFSEVKEGDTILYAGLYPVTVERVSVSQHDGHIGVHANNDTWTTHFRPDHTVELIFDEQQANEIDMAMYEDKLNDGYARREQARAMRLQLDIDGKLA